MSDIRELVTVGTIFKSADEEIRVTVKDAGQGPRVDARIHALADGNATRNVKRGGRWVEVPAYCGPTKAGLWLTIEQAAELVVMLEQATDAADLLRKEQDAENAPRPDWNCPDCGTDNIAEARQCGRCNAKKRAGVLA